MLYIYAIVGTRPERLPVGIAGDDLEVARIGRLFMVVAHRSAVPPLTAGTLRRQNEIVRFLTDQVDAVLPARFGTLIDPALLERAASEREDELLEALALVKGCAQMTLRIFGPGDDKGGAPQEAWPGRPGFGATDRPMAGGPGARYLQKLQDARTPSVIVPEFESARTVFAPFIASERCERHATPPLVASVWHLIRRDQIGRYRRAARTAAKRIAPYRLTVTGPWAPYAFSPEMAA